LPTTFREAGGDLAQGADLDGVDELGEDVAAGAGDVLQSLQGGGGLFRVLLA
jgi:hypothetical protein